MTPSHSASLGLYVVSSDGLCLPNPLASPTAYSPASIEAILTYDEYRWNVEDALAFILEGAKHSQAYELVQYVIDVKPLVSGEPLIPFLLPF